MAAATIDNGVYVDVHGRRLGMRGDGPNQSVLLLDGKPIANGLRERVQTVVTGRNGAGAITLAGVAADQTVAVGDRVVSVVNLTTPADASASFEAAITVAGQIQQTSASDLSASKFLVYTLPLS